ncbi:MAG: hypothetical protein RLZZ292_1004 [Bacteroidota bacterium]|jgi:hypothetical protein
MNQSFNRSLSFLLFLFFVQIASAQVSDTTKIQHNGKKKGMSLIKIADTTTTKLTIADTTNTLIDSSALVKKSFFKQKKDKLNHFLFFDYPNPKAALYLSLVLPGAGQIYNKRWLPVHLGIGYAGVGAAIYGIRYNTKYYHLYRDGYYNYVNKIEDTTDLGKALNLGQVSASTVKGRRDIARKQMEQSWIGLFGAYAFLSIDAYITAHLKTFTLSDDISLNLHPTLEKIGVGATVKF